MGTFHLIDLLSQAAAVRAVLAGRTRDEKLAWLALRGTLTVDPDSCGREFCVFRSVVGLACVFFLDGDDLVFIVGHTTWVAPRS